MKVSPDLIRCEFLGNEAKITRSSHEGNVGISGKIVDETRNTFTLAREGKRKIIIKDSSLFRISFPDKTIVEIEGRLLTGRSEDRLKKTVRRLW
jgi:ribonuclease P protein subunit POP4